MPCTSWNELWLWLWLRNERLSIYRKYADLLGRRVDVRVYNVVGHVSRRRHGVACEHSAPPRTDLLLSDPVDVAGIGGTYPERVGVLAVKTTVILADGVAAPFDEPGLDIHAGACKTHPGAGKPQPGASKPQTVARMSAPGSSQT